MLVVKFLSFQWYWIAFRFAEQVVPKISSGGGSETDFVIVFGPEYSGEETRTEKETSIY